jgi:hypothetical protein
VSVAGLGRSGVRAKPGINMAEFGELNSSRLTMERFIHSSFTGPHNRARPVSPEFFHRLLGD